jgi:hypothetical protein
MPPMSPNARTRTTRALVADSRSRPESRRPPRGAMVVERGCCVVSGFVIAGQPAASAEHLARAGSDRLRRDRGVHVPDREERIEIAHAGRGLQGDPPDERVTPAP